MSDSSQDIVAPHVRESDAPAVASSALRWLQGQQIVAEEPTRCVLGLEDNGYAPGPHWRRAAQDDADFLTLASNGLELITARTVFDTGGNGIELTCESCRAVFEPGEAYMEAIEQWSEGGNDAEYACDRCGFAALLTDWTGPWACGFGCVGLRFWNWPPLRAEFIESIAQFLGGRVVLVRCHT